jgi:hypothetical protein
MNVEQRPGPLRYAGQPSMNRGDTTNLADLLERILDKGIVIAGDISISLVDVELLTIKLRLLVASVDKAQEMGVNWWQSDPWLSSRAADQRREAGNSNGESEREGAGQATDQRALTDRLERLEAAIERLQLSSDPDGGGARNGRTRR